MFEKKINANISADNTTLTIAKASAISAPTQSPSAIQNTTYIGRDVSYPSSSPLTNMTPTNLPPPYIGSSASSTSGVSVVPPYSSLVLQANSTSRSMDDVNVIKSVVNIANLSPENIKRRSFFFLLKDRLTEYINSSPCIACCDSGYDNWGLSQECNQTNCPTCCIWISPPPCGTSETEGIRKFATRLALGFTYMYQDIIPLLDTESNKRLTDYFVDFIHSYFFDNRDCCAGKRTHSIYSILMNSLNLYLPGSQNCNVKNLKTVDGFTFSFNHLLSLGVCTIEGGLYEATNPRNVQLFKELKDRNNFPHYRWGTSDAIKIDLLTNYGKKIHLRKVEGSVSDHIYLQTETRKAEAHRGTSYGYLANALESSFSEFWNRADALANNYLSQDEFQSYTKLIPAECKSTYLLQEQYISDN